MNVYQVSIEPKPQKGAAQSMAPGNPRTIVIVTNTLQDAINIARTKITSSEEVSGVYIIGSDAIVDYTQVINATGGN